MAGLDLERLIQTERIDRTIEPAAVGEPDQEPDRVAGLYWDETNPAAYYVIRPWDRKLILDRPGKAHLVFKPGKTPDRYVYEGSADAWIEFLRADAGEVEAMRSSFGGHVEVAPRDVRPADLPSVAEVVERVRQAHHLDRLGGLGVVRLAGSVEIEARQAKGRYELVFDATRQRSAAEFGAAEEVSVVNGDRAWSHATPTGTQKLTGSLREQTFLDRFAVIFGDWRRYYRQVEVLKRLRHGDESYLMVRVVPQEALGATLFIDEATGRVLGVDSLVQLPGVGIVGVQARYGDFHDVGGMVLPFTTAERFATPLIGRIVTSVERAETGVEVDDRVFSRP